MNPFSFLGKRARASRANERGRELDRLGRAADAIQEYERACRLDPTWSVPLFNLGLVHKYAGEWERSLRCNHRASELDPDDQGRGGTLALLQPHWAAGTRRGQRGGVPGWRCRTGRASSTFRASEHRCA